MSLKLKIPPLIVALLCGMLMWGIDTWLVIESLTFEVPWWGYVFFFISGFLMSQLGVITFSKHQTTTHPQHPEEATTLIRSGVYRFSRNPMYLGLLLVLLAGVLYFGNGATIVVLLLYVWYMNCFQIIPEEKVLQQKFGEAYREYKTNVRRWI